MGSSFGLNDPTSALPTDHDTSGGTPGSLEETSPRSVVCQRDVIVSLILFALALAYLRWDQATDAISAFLVLAAAICVPHVWRASSGLVFVVRSETGGALARIGRKLIALALIYGVVAIGYFVFPAFHDNYVRPVLEILQRFWPFLLVLAPVYVWLTDSFMAEPQDGLYQVGLALTNPAAGVNWPLLRQYLLGWVVKAFFLPLMISFAEDDIKWALSLNILGDLARPTGYYDILYRLIYFIDVMISSVGYIMTLRLFNTQIRTSDSTALGWLVCLVCYPPFWDSIYNNFLKYDGDFYWDDWLGGHPATRIVWGVLILVASATYVWGTLSFGMRFSNLTNRGIITNGAYRWMKHPCYVAKNISWWMISVPFVVNTTPGDAFRKCVELAIINFIYYMRAKTEERHLSADPDYVAYSKWMESNSLYFHGRKFLRAAANIGIDRK